MNIIFVIISLSIIICVSIFKILNPYHSNQLFASTISLILVQAINNNIFGNKFNEKIILLFVIIYLITKFILEKTLNHNEIFNTNYNMIEITISSILFYILFCCLRMMIYSKNMLSFNILIIFVIWRLLSYWLERLLA